MMLVFVCTVEVFVCILRGLYVRSVRNHWNCIFVIFRDYWDVRVASVSVIWVLVCTTELFFSAPRGINVGWSEISDILDLAIFQRNFNLRVGSVSIMLPFAFIAGVFVSTLRGMNIRIVQNHWIRCNNLSRFSIPLNLSRRIGRQVRTSVSESRTSAPASWCLLKGRVAG